MAIASFVGGFRVESAVETQMQIIQSAFRETAAHLGFARASNMKILLIAGWITSVIMLIFVPVWGFVIMNIMM